jgi:hypothetical protein
MLNRMSRFVSCNANGRCRSSVIDLMT